MTVHQIYDKIAEGYDTENEIKEFQAQDAFVYEFIDALIFAMAEHSGDSPPVYDFGCGTGALIDALQIPPQKYIGYDVSRVMLLKAKKKHPGHKFVKLNMMDVTPPKNCLIVSLWGSACYMSQDDFDELLFFHTRSHQVHVMYGKGRNKSTHTAKQDSVLHPVLYSSAMLRKYRSWGFVVAGVDIRWLTCFLSPKWHMRAVKALARIRLPLSWYTWVLIYAPKSFLSRLFS